VRGFWEAGGREGIKGELQEIESKKAGFPAVDSAGLFS
jgi:hypothetical protein